MNVDGRLSVNVTGLQKAFRLCSLSAVVFCCIHMNFLCDIICIFEPLSIPCLLRMWGCVCLRPVYIGSNFVTYTVYVCLHLSKGLISM